MRLTVCAAALALAMPAFAQQEVKIGTVFPISGPSAHLGKDTENGARLAIEDLNAAGFSIGGQKVKLVLMAEDDGGEPKQGTAAAQKLVDAKVAGVIGHLNSGTSLPASKIYHAAGIPQITPSATAPAYTKQGFNTTFRLVVNDNRVGGTLGKYAAQTMKVKRVAIIDDRTAFGQGLADEFAKGVKAAGNVEVVSRQFTTDKASDFSAILTQIRAQKPDAIFFGGMDAVGGPMLKQMRTLGMRLPFLGGDGLCSEKLPHLAADGLADDQVVCAVAGGVTGSQEETFNKWVARYEKRFGIPWQTYGPYAYDGVMILAQAMQKAGSADPAVYLKTLAATKYAGITGNISFDKFGDLNEGALTLYTYRKGKLAKLAVVR